MSKVLDRLRDLLRAEDDIVADELRSEATGTFSVRAMAVSVSPCRTT